MVTPRYFVSYFLHNQENGGWAYKVVGSYTTLDAAKKSYFSELSTYIDGPTFDHVAVTLTDLYGNNLYYEYWSSSETAPEVTIVSIEQEGNVYTITYSDGRVEIFTAPEPETPSEPEET